MASHDFPSEYQHQLEITFNGNLCLMPDVNGELIAHIQRHYSQFFEPANPVSDGVSLAHSACDAKPPVILPSWNLEPRLGLYQLYWPLGFSRSAKIYALIERSKISTSNLNAEDGFRPLSVTLRRRGPLGSPIVVMQLPMTITKRAFVTEDVVLCELRDGRFLWSSRLIQEVERPKSPMTLKEFVFAMTELVIPSNIDFRKSPLLNLLPDVNVDLDALWRYDTPAMHLLDAALGAHCYISNELFFSLLPGPWVDKEAEIDALVPRLNNAKRQKMRILFPELSNGRVRNDISYFSLRRGDGEISRCVTCSAPASPPATTTDNNYLADAIFSAEAEVAPLNGFSFDRKARYHLDEFIGSHDAVVFDFNASGAGVGYSKIPKANFPYQRHYYWLKDTKPTCEPMDVIRIQLLENMPVCSDAAALHLSNLSGEDCPCESMRQVLVRDTVGIARTKIQNGQRFAPAQSMGFARHLACSDTGEMDVYELVSIGQGCCPPPESSSYEECCEPWFTRFENLGTVTDKAVGAEIAYGETIGQLKGSGSAHLNYKAYLSSSDVSDGCAIDLSGIHSFSTQNSRTSGTSPCTPSFDQCAIDYALLKMSGRLPIDEAACKEWYEDLSGAGTGDDYYERKIKSDPENCSYSKKVYNFTSVRTTVLTKGADYIVLKHWCDPTSSSSSGSGVDECCAQFTDYDMRCVGGVLQRWKKVTEVCWDGDCLVTRVVSDWENTGETAGCCDCGSGTGSSSSGAASSSSGSGGGVDTTCCPNNLIPEVLNITVSGGACAGSYTMVWRPGQLEWTSDDGPPNTNFRLACSEGVWYLTIGMNGYSPNTVSCNPFSLSFTVTGDPLCGNFTITITG